MFRDGRAKTSACNFSTFRKTGAWLSSFTPILPTHQGRSFVAPSFDALADAPAELGTFDEFNFYAGGRTIRVVVHGKGWNRGDLTDMLTRIANYETSLMGGAPDREYLFILHIGFGWGGGMEHSDCTAISVGSVVAIAGHRRARILSPVECEALAPAVA